MAMTAEMVRRPRPAALVHPSLLGRIYGLGSVFGKTLRDSRWSMVIVAGVLGIMIVAGGGTMATTYGTLETRAELAFMTRTLPPTLVGLYGDPVRVDTLGGFISWHYGAYFALLAGLWSILALASTLAGEARRGSLEFAAVTPRSRRVLALQKLAAHVVAVSVVVAVLAVLAWATGAIFGRFEGDPIALDAAFAFAAGVGLKALVAGSIAFAIAPFLGRGAAAGIAGAVMLAAYLLNSYRTVVPAFDGPANLAWFAWTRGHVPLAGRYDWLSLGLVALVAVMLLAAGVEGFARRDVGVTVRLRTPRMPRSLRGLRRPMLRAFGEVLPTATWWGLGLGSYGFVMAMSSTSFADALRASPGVLEAFRNIVPGMDLTTSAGFLQFVFIDMGLALVGLAAATLVAGWASDETSGRFELLLTTPLTRVRWALESGVGAWLGIAVAVALVAVWLGIGVAATGDDPVAPVVGLVAVALYGAAMAGIGFAVGGLTRPSFAAPAVVAVTIGTFLVQLLAPALRLPDWVRQLALSDHMGRPLVGSWDPAGLAACVVLAIGGLLLGAWGLHRRDVEG
jgi:ABC-2 type transport system permease protein